MYLSKACWEVKSIYCKCNYGIQLPPPPGPELSASLFAMYLALVLSYKCSLHCLHAMIQFGLLISSILHNTGWRSRYYLLIGD